MVVVVVVVEEEEEEEEEQQQQQQRSTSAGFRCAGRGRVIARRASETPRPCRTAAPPSHCRCSEKHERASMH